MHTSFILLIVVPALASALQAPPCDCTTSFHCLFRFTVHGTQSYMTYPKSGGHIEVRTDTPADSGSLFCRVKMEDSDQGVVYKAIEANGHKVLRHNGEENEPAGVYEYLKLNGGRYLSPVDKPEYFYLEPQNAQGMVLKHDTDTNEVILVPIDHTDPNIRWDQFTKRET